MSIQLHKCAFVLKNTQNFIDLDACKQLVVLNSYKSAIKKTEVKKKNNKSMFLWSDLNHDLNQTTLTEPEKSFKMQLRSLF